MRPAIFLLLHVVALATWANDSLWEKLETEANLVVLMRHTQPAGGDPLAWDESGNCQGESMLIAEGELLVGRANEKGELDVLGKIQVQP